MDALLARQYKGYRAAYEVSNNGTAAAVIAAAATTRASTGNSSNIAKPESLDDVVEAHQQSQHDDVAASAPNNRSKSIISVTNNATTKLAIPKDGDEEGVENSSFIVRPRSFPKWDVERYPLPCFSARGREKPMKPRDMDHNTGEL